MSLPELPPASGGPAAAPKPAKTHHLQVDLRGFDEDQLLELRAAIDERLPRRALKDVNLEHELVRQLLTIQKLQREVLEAGDVPANQKAQTANAVAAVLQQLSKLQVEVYTSERLKKIEDALIDALKLAPMESQRAWLEAYERLGGGQ